MWTKSARNPNPKPPLDTVVVRAGGLTKYFDRHLAVDRLDLEIRAGEVFGLLGPSGAGKSTILGLLLGLVTPTSGQLAVFDRDPAGGPLPHRIGSLIETPALYPFLTGRECLEALALVTGGVSTHALAELLALVGLSDTADRRINTYTGGMRQRLGLAAALVDDPALVLLDEPTRDLEPNARAEIHQLIPRLARQGRAVIVTGSRWEDIAQVCDRATVLRQGQVIATGWVDELLRCDDADAMLDPTAAAGPAAPGKSKRRHVADAA